MWKEIKYLMWQYDVCTVVVFQLETANNPTAATTAMCCVYSLVLITSVNFPACSISLRPSISSFIHRLDTMAKQAWIKWENTQWLLSINSIFILQIIKSAHFHTINNIERVQSGRLLMAFPLSLSLCVVVSFVGSAVFQERIIINNCSNSFDFDMIK